MSSCFIGRISYYEVDNVGLVLYLGFGLRGSRGEGRAYLWIGVVVFGFIFIFKLFFGWV